MQTILPWLKEKVTLILLNLKVKWINGIEYFKVVYRYYGKYDFFKIDSLLLLNYFFKSPFWLSKTFLEERGEADIYTYGETPLTTLEMTSKAFRLSKKDKVFELGCGRGRTCFWLNQFVGCTVVGIDFVPAFIEKANKVKARCGVSGVTFLLEDLFQADLTGATVIYLYGICYSDEEIRCLADIFSRLPSGTKVITVSYSLREFQEDAPFQVVNQIQGAFTWGKTEVYLQVRQ